MPRTTGVAKTPAKDTEKPTAFKHLINAKVVRAMSASLVNAHPSFDAKSFARVAPKLDALEFKPRVQAISAALAAHLPSDFRKALPIIVRAAQDGTLKVFELWPYFDFVQTHGLEHPKESLAALRTLTPLFTAEWAVRPYLTQHRALTYKTLAGWLRDDNEHVRRWISEGTRPRLPWGERLGDAVRDPSEGLRLLEGLKHDDSLYVRKSVANHLNDIAKDHPELVVRTLKTWAAECPAQHAEKIDWITRRALRTLIKEGHAKALALIGIGTKTEAVVQDLTLNKTSLKFPDTLEFSFTISTDARKAQKLVVDYVIHHVKSNQERSPKVFKLKTFTLPARGSVTITKRHALKPITTRVYHAGLHLLEIQVNGSILARQEWTLRM